MNRFEVKAAEYRAKAKEASSLAAEASLASVRETRSRSAAVWTEMAAAAEARARSLRGAPPGKSVRARPPAVVSERAGPPKA